MQDSSSSPSKARLRSDHLTLLHTIIISATLLLATSNSTGHRKRILQTLRSRSMSLVSSQYPSNIVNPLSTDLSKSPADDSDALGLLHAFTHDAKTSMDRSATEFSQSGLPTPYPHAFTGPQSEDSPADHASAAQSPYPPQQEARPTSEYAVQAPASARSTGSFKEQGPRQQFYTASNQSGSSGAMAQQPPSPSSLQERQTPQIKSDQDVPIDPSIATSSPSYPPQNGQYSPYPPQEMQQQQHAYAGGHPGGAMYQQPSEYPQNTRSNASQRIVRNSTQQLLTF